MDKQFWHAVTENDYAIPDGHTLENLTDILFSFLGSTDPELRDDIAYMVYANWLKQEKFSREEVSSHIEKLLTNLQKGIGETESDTVFLRAFSVLLLAEIVHNDNKKPLLEKDTVQKILASGLSYLEAEKDPRGHVPVKGWAHALAHTADLLLVLARNRNTDEADLWKMLTGIANKIVHSTDHVYIHGEDERLANAVIEILGRDLVSLNQLEAWANSLSHPDGKDWKGVYVEQDKNLVYQNTRNLLRSIYLAMISEQEQVPDGENIARVFLNTLNDMKRY